MDAIDLTRKVIIDYHKENYLYWKNKDPEFAEDRYSPERWATESLENLCSEIHQIAFYTEDNKYILNFIYMIYRKSTSGIANVFDTIMNTTHHST